MMGICLCRLAKAQTGNDSYAANNCKPVILSIYLHSKNNIVFNSEDAPITFKNPSAGDSLITKAIYTDKPTHLFYKRMFITATGTRQEAGNLLLFPGDSVVLQNNGSTIRYSTGFQTFIDSFINFTILGSPGEPVQYQLFDSIGLMGMLEKIKRDYLVNDRKITASALPFAQVAALKQLNYITQASQICAIPFAHIKPAEKPVLDNAYRQLLAHADSFMLIKSLFAGSVYYQLIAYNALSNTSGPDDFWTYLIRQTAIF
ncbi:hypothetical protein [Deminuibacter soli]|uniref:Uncharacterized protein n=1 Tax=Deminuibacter soli TaxID=2291815 RepID=A0A3E1NKW4_9BACT|nr:hypothetical protein [Deminuibacter soli]RFM28531.1 hypothetical protein DXN05_06915 [Deminuibacter soli]